MGFEINKIIVAIFVTILVVFGIGKVSDLIFKTETNVIAYKVEMEEKPSSGEAVAASVDIKTLLALGNVEHGLNVFKKCKACHSIKKGGKNKMGPALYGVMTRNSGKFPGYKYSKALIAHNKKWSFEELNGFLLKPANWIKGNKMGFAGLKDDKDRASTMLYLNQMSDTPIPLP